MDYNNGRSYDSGNGDYPYRGKPPEYGYTNKYREFFSNPENKEILRISAVFGIALIFHVLLQNIYSIVLTSNKDIYSLYADNEIFSLTAEMLYSLICVGIPFIFSYFFLLKKNFSGNCIPFRKSDSLSQTFFLIIAGVGLCMVGNIATSLLMSYAGTVGVGFHSYDQISQMSSDVPDSILIFLLTLIHTAILPAFIEEIAIRGCLMQPLRKFGDIFAVVTSAFIFGILHGNLTQAPFAFFAGIVLGLVCVYTGSMWPNIIIHLINNAISVFQSVAVAHTGSKYTYLISAVIIYGLIIIGGIALFGFFYTKKFVPQFYRPLYGKYKKKTLIFFLCPSTLIALLYFAVELYSDIYII